MALIKCSECGHEISDKANACPNCGCPIEKGLVCKECGAELSPIDEVCPNCGNPIQTAVNGSNRNSIKYVLLASFTLVVLSVIYGSYKHFSKGSNCIAASVDSTMIAKVNTVSNEEQTQEEKDREEQARQQYLKHEEQREVREQQNRNRTPSYHTLPTNSYGSMNSSTANGNTSSNPYRFFNAASVLDYLQNKTFTNGRSRVRIKFEGVYINGSCLTGAPIVERFESHKALVRASVVGGGGTFRVMVDPINNRLLDQDGTEYYLKK